MELYYKDLISEEASLEKLVDDLMLVVQGVDELVQAAGVTLEKEKKDEITSRLQRLKEGCRKIEQHAVDSALAVDKVMRQYPYSSAGFAFAIGIILGRFLKKR
ncbi:MAG TPA: hypothetical protein VEC99_19330 [Clostridia bacterium]|nr:hypothetical protein [Clostridia bacterium]